MAEPFSLADYLQGRRNALLDEWATPPPPTNALLDEWATPPPPTPANSLAGAFLPQPNALISYGKGSVQPIPQAPLGQSNVLDRVARSFGQPSLDMVTGLRDEMERSGRLPERSFGEQLGILGMMPMGPFGSVKSLPMDQAARLARARDMGFDTSRTWYHGTDTPFSAFERSHEGALGPGVYLTNNPTYASNYALSWANRDSAPHVVPTYVRGDIAELATEYPSIARGMSQGTYAPPDDVLARIHADLRRRGYGGLSWEDEAVIFDPASIRSVNATFDPAFRDSPNLLKGPEGPPRIPNPIRAFGRD